MSNYYIGKLKENKIVSNYSVFCIFKCTVDEGPSCVTFGMPLYYFLLYSFPNVHSLYIFNMFRNLFINDTAQIVLYVNYNSRGSFPT